MPTNPLTSDEIAALRERSRVLGYVQHVDLIPFFDALESAQRLADQVNSDAKESAASNVADEQEDEKELEELRAEAKRLQGKVDLRDDLLTSVTARLGIAPGLVTRDMLNSALDDLRAQVTRLEQERDALMNAIHPTRLEKGDFWTVEKIATLAEAHRDDTDTLDGCVIRQDSYGTDYDYQHAAFQRQVRIEAAEDRAAELLAKVRNVNTSPWMADISGFMYCDWCDAKVEMPYYEDRDKMEMGYEMQPHPQNGCLFAEASWVSSAQSRASTTHDRNAKPEKSPLLAPEEPSK